MIKTKDDAFAFLDEQFEYFHECGMLFPRQEHFFIFCAQQMVAMKNTIVHNKEFFDYFFKDKTEDEIKQWIEKEAEQWQK